MDVRNKRVVIIGGSSGMGLSTAIAAVQEGAQVTIVSRSKQKLTEAKAKVGSSIETFAADFTQEDHVKHFFAHTEMIDHLVNTAANVSAGPFLNQETEAVRSSFESKFWGQYYTVKYGTPKMSSNGSITLFSGIAAWKPLQGGSTFAAINGAILALCRTLAVELAPLRINVIAPGTIHTPFWDSVAQDFRNEFLVSFAEKLPVKRVGTSDDIAQAVLYLMKNGFTTGSVVTIDGGHQLI
jgi:NAD(P)-dependent dehydrogenase (short-subunit alcohol dehydrogenase family)